jgi:hypothetical protein
VSRLGHLAPEYGLSPQSRAGLTYACYVPLALALAGPVVPWGCGSFLRRYPRPACSARSSGRHSLILFGRAWIGGAVMTRISACHRGIAAVG